MASSRSRNRTGGPQGSEQRPDRHRAGPLAEIAARAVREKRSVRLTGLRGAAMAAAGAELVRAAGDRPVLFVTSGSKRGDEFLADLRTALGEAGPDSPGGSPSRTRTFPRHDIPPYDRFSPQPFLLARRMEVLYRWIASPPAAREEPGPVVVAPAAALALRVPGRDRIRARTVHLEVGQRIDRDRLVETLVSAGYSRMPLVEERGEIAVRGGILDVFPPHLERPVRVELLGDEVESIREFDPASQRSQQRLVHAVAPPPRELLVGREEVVARRELLRERARALDVPDRHLDELVDGLLRGHVPPGGEALAPLLLPELESVFDFLPEDTCVVVVEPAAVFDRLARYAEEVREGWRALEGTGRLAAPPEELFLDPESISSALRAREPVWLERQDIVDATEEAARVPVPCSDVEPLRAELARARAGERALSPLAERVHAWCQDGLRVVLATSRLSAADRLKHLLADYGLEARIARQPQPLWRWSAPGRLEIRVGDLSSGFVLPREGLAVVTEEEITGPRPRQRTARAFREGVAIEALAQLAPGDPLVHAEHGIGIYRGLVELDLSFGRGEFLRLEYEGGDRLFVPVTRLNLVHRYAGADGGTPRLDRLGGSTWERARRNVRKALRDMARELIAIHAARELAPGHAFSPRDRMMEEFEATFPFEETPDQLAAIEETLADLARPRPMDRLVCGDVGFGKTEVAVRAAFRVAMDGKQVAVLVPTTILCQQHEKTFRERFSGYPIRVESLSRFRTPREARKVLEGLASGEVDVVIGTHRLLQPRVRFRDLGLLVVDEEQRFGVAHKERIKQMRKTVDVLTLTATPIPRTLELAFSGLRDLSVIETPPRDRLAIRSQVCRESEPLIREAILRELRRGGQVFYVYNRVRGIERMAAELARIVPEARVLVAHGQMRERELEDRMLAFLRGEADVLLCTTIIENGLDVPRANTILIHRADTFGLAQLYQLRGRVGRSGHRAYAYLLVPPESSLGPQARKRLEAIQDLSELGAGFRLAHMDLEIRGAGNLLGAEQSGHLEAVGYDTYMELFQETLAEMRGEMIEREVDPEIRLPVEARLPDDYVADTSQRLVLYKRLASAPDEAELERLRGEILDRFGPLPPPAGNLLRVIALKIAARRLGIAAVDVGRGELVLSAGRPTRIDPERLVRLMTQAGTGIRVSPEHKIYAPLPPEAGDPARGADPERLFEVAHRVLDLLGPPLPAAA